jgi:uncharacterized membrane protein YccC
MSGSGDTAAVRAIPGLRVPWPAVMAPLQYGLRLWASVSLALMVAFWLQLENPFWAGATAGIVCQPSLGTTLRKGWFRAIGTLFGGVAIVALASAFPQSRSGLLIGLTLWGALCGFVTTILRNFASYAAALAGYTAVIVFSDTVSAPDQAFNFAVARATEINIGIVAAGVVLIVTDFGDTRRRLERVLSDVGRGVAAGLAETLATGLETSAARALRRDLIRQVIALDATVDEALGESSDLRARSPALQAAIEGLFIALSAWRGIGNHLNTMDADAKSEIALSGLSGSIERICLGWGDNAVAIRDLCGKELRGVLAIPALDPSMRILVTSVADALGALQRVANGLVLVTAPGHVWQGHGSKHLYVADVLPAIINALRVVAVLAMAELAWIETAWPGGQGMITFAAIIVILFSPRSEDAYPTAVGFAIGTVLAVGLAAVVNFAILPGQQTFAGLSLVLAGVLVPAGAMAAGSWHKPAFLGMVTLFIPLLAPTNQPVYDPVQFLNEALVIVAGTILAAISLRVVPPVRASWRIRRLLSLTLRDLSRLAIGRRWLDESRWIGHVSSRLAAMPVEATSDEGAQLLAALSAGQAVIRLREMRQRLADPAALDHALGCLAAADIAGARDGLARFLARPSIGNEAAAPDEVHARAAAAVIREILDRHGRFFAMDGV